MTETVTERQLFNWMCHMKSAKLGRSVSVFYPEFDIIATEVGLSGIFDYRYTNNVTGNQEELFEMARNGKPKPIAAKDPLGNVIVTYTCPSQPMYDPIFAKKIKRLRPDWYTTITANNKKELFRMVRNGEDKPRSGRRRPETRLGNSLLRYINPNSTVYDPILVAEIKKLRPDWLVTAISINKKELLKMAKNEENRPICIIHPLGRLLVNYTNPNHGCYDPEFSKEIRELRPNWFRR